METSNEACGLTCQYSFAVYCLAKHPAVEEKVVREIDAFYSKLEKDGLKDAARPTYDELAQFPYVEQVR